jgi:predicted nucleotidyltransferase
MLLKDYFDIEKMYLFGSYAKGTNRADSDIDVAIVVNTLPGDYFATTPLLWKLRRQVDDRIEPILIEKGKDVSVFLQQIQESGIEIVEEESFL